MGWGVKVKHFTGAGQAGSASKGWSMWAGVGRFGTWRGPRALRACVVGSVVLGVLGLGGAARGENLHFTYLWHLEQPIYWPDQQASGDDRYERAWQSIQRTDAGAAHPANDLREVFGKDDRVAAYQWRPRDTISAISWSGEAGAQISYSGGLIENVTSLGAAGQLGYSPSWYGAWREARGWPTSGAGVPRCDIVLFPFHHSILPLLDESAVRKEIQLYRAVYDDAWGASPGVSKGLFPPEICFSERLIPAFVAEGVEWVVVSNEHISRACANFPLMLGSGGVNCDPPNLADQINPAQGNWFRRSISRGCSPASAYPYAYTPHRAKYIDPETGAESTIIVVPADQALSWDDGYSPLGLDAFDTLQAANPPGRPQLVLLAHDGDNAWGGGYSYYMEAVPNFVSSASEAGYVPTVVQEYLSDHPVPMDDIVHVEDGGWVNADGDFGSPTFINWNWPLVDGSGQIDIAGGWAEDERNWAVIIAAQNRVDTAEQIGGAPNINKILYPDGSANDVERAWHYFLGALNSGYMYYGTALDMEVKPTIACNEAVEHADAVIGDGSADATPPTVWIPQRHPYNPGSTNFGAQWGYTPTPTNGDVWFWTFVYDVSGVSLVTLEYRVDADGVNPLGTSENETYAGGAGVGAWTALPMVQRAFPAGNFHNDPSIDFFEMPQYIADEYSIELTGERDVLIDYYVEATDTRGYSRRTPIQHVYIGPGGGTSDPTVTVDPDPPLAGQDVTVAYDPAGGPLAGAGQVYMHYGFNSWNPVISADPAMTWNAGDAVWEVTVSVSSVATQLDVVFNDGAGTWDNNNGQDWHFAVEGGGPSDAWVMDGVLDAGATPVAENGALVLYAGLIGPELYVAAPDAGEGNDHFIFVANAPGAIQAAPWAKSGQVAAWSAFLADENDNDYSGWFDTTATTRSATHPSNGGVLEGTIRLDEEFGALPDAVYLAFAPYATADGGALISFAQVPTSTDGDGDVDAAEYVRFALASGGPAADFDGDDDVDLADYGRFLDCYNGPENPPAGPDCDAADLDGDGDVDLADYGEFLDCYNGPANPPACG
jgi:hypothetical protein